MPVNTVFNRTKIFLGHVITEKGVSICPKTIEDTDLPTA